MARRREGGEGWLRAGTTRHGAQEREGRVEVEGRDNETWRTGERGEGEGKPPFVILSSPASSAPLRYPPSLAVRPWMYPLDVGAQRRAVDERCAQGQGDWDKCLPHVPCTLPLSTPHQLPDTPPVPPPCAPLCALPG